MQAICSTFLSTYLNKWKTVRHLTLADNLAKKLFYIKVDIIPKPLTEYFVKLYLN